MKQTYHKRLMKALTQLETVRDTVGLPYSSNLVLLQRVTDLVAIEKRYDRLVSQSALQIVGADG